MSIGHLYLQQVCKRVWRASSRGASRGPSPLYPHQNLPPGSKWVHHSSQLEEGYLLVYYSLVPSWRRSGGGGFTTEPQYTGQLTMVGWLLLRWSHVQMIFGKFGLAVNYCGWLPWKDVCKLLACAKFYDYRVVSSSAVLCHWCPCRVPQRRTLSTQGWSTQWNDQLV